MLSTATNFENVYGTQVEDRCSEKGTTSKFQNVMWWYSQNVWEIFLGFVHKWPYGLRGEGVKDFMATILKPYCLSMGRCAKNCSKLRDVAFIDDLLDFIYGLDIFCFSVTVIQPVFRSVKWFDIWNQYIFGCNTDDPYFSRVRYVLSFSSYYNLSYYNPRIPKPN